MNVASMRRRASPVSLPGAARGPVFAMAGDADIQALTRAFDVHNAEAMRSIKAMQGSIGSIEAEITKLNEAQAALAVSGSGFPVGSNARRDPQYKALGEFCRGGGQMEFGQFLAAKHPEIRAAASVGSDPDGGYSVIPQWETSITQVLRDISPMRAISRVMPTSNTSVKLLVDKSLSDAAWVGETQARPVTANPNLVEVEIVAREIYAQPQATQALLDDAFTDIAAWLGTSVSTSFAIAEGKAFVSGDGINKPMGFLSYPIDSADDFARTNWASLGYVPTGATSPTDKQLANAIIAASLRLRAPYRSNSSWMMNRDVARVVRQLRDLQDRPLWSTDGRVVDGAPDRLLGWPVVYSEDMPAIAANSCSIAVGDFRQGYTIVDRVGVRVLRDPYSAKPYVSFYTTKRVGGSMIDFNALKLIRWSVS